MFRVQGIGFRLRVRVLSLGGLVGFRLRFDQAAVAAMARLLLLESEA